jgi:hypothetical protein
VSEAAPFDPYTLFEALEGNKVHYVVVGGFARVVHGTAELTRGLDIAPALVDYNLRALERALGDLGVDAEGLAQLTPEALASTESIAIPTPAGTLTVITAPWGTRGYEDLRIRGNRENLGRSLRPRIASRVDLVRMLEASPRAEDADRLQRIRRMIELERQRTRSRSLRLER